MITKLRYERKPLPSLSPNIIKIFKGICAGIMVHTNNFDSQQVKFLSKQLIPLFLALDHTYF